MCYSLRDKQSRARKESAESTLTTKAPAEEVTAPAVTARTASTEGAFARFLSGVHRLVPRRQKESIS